MIFKMTLIERAIFIYSPSNRKVQISKQNSNTGITISLNLFFGFIFSTPILNIIIVIISQTKRSIEMNLKHFYVSLFLLLFT